MLRDELIVAVSRGAGLPTQQAGQAVAAMLRFFTARLPSALVGQLHVLLDGTGVAAGEDGGVRAPPK